MDKKGGDKKDKDKDKDKDSKQQQKQAPKEEKKEETAEERRQKAAKEELRAERKAHKKEHQRHLHEAHAAGNVMDDLSKKQVFKKFTYRGNDIGKLLEMNMDQISQELRSRQRRRLRRKMGAKYGRFIKKLLQVKKETNPGEKPAPVKTHLRNCIVLPTMIQSVVNVHNGKGYNSIEVKPEMIGYYLGEFAMTYKRVSHGKPGVGATHSSKFVPIK